MQRRILAAAALLVAALGTRADASIVVNFEQVGSDVVATGTGTLNLAALTPTGGGGPMFGGVDPDFPDLGMGPTTHVDGIFYKFVTGPTSWGTGSETDASFGSGDYFGVLVVKGFGGLLFLSPDYVSNAPLSASDTYSNATFSSLGITPGTYIYTWGTGADADSFTINFGVAAVPEPSSILNAGFATLTGLAVWARRRGMMAIA
jgi:hypothetical protein